MPFSDPNPVLKKFPDGIWEVMQPITYTTPAGYLVEIPVGFKTDLASIPRLVWSIFPRDGDYAPAAIVHDYLYRYHRMAGRAVDRPEADGIFLDGMVDLGIGWATRWTIYAAVRAGGLLAWRAGGHEVESQ